MLALRLLIVLAAFAAPALAAQQDPFATSGLTVAEDKLAEEEVAVLDYDYYDPIPKCFLPLHPSAFNAC